MLPGVKVILGGKPYVAPSLTMRDLASFDEAGQFDGKGLDGVQSVSGMREYWSCVPRASLLRNYSPAEVEAALGDADLWDLAEAKKAIQTMSFGARKPTASGDPEADSPAPAAT